MEKEYHLFLLIEGNNSDNILSNMHHIHSDTLQELDKFTSAYLNAQDLGDEINLTEKRIPISSAIILSDTELLKLRDEKKLFIPIKTEPVLFLEDKEFVKNQSKDLSGREKYNDLLIYNYKNYLLNNRRLIANSLFQHVKIGVDVNSSISQNHLEQVVYAYYKIRSYKKMRSTYLELKKMLPSLFKTNTQEQNDSIDHRIKR